MTIYKLLIGSAKHEARYRTRESGVRLHEGRFFTSFKMIEKRPTRPAGWGQARLGLNKSLCERQISGVIDLGIQISRQDFATSGFLTASGRLERHEDAVNFG